MNRPPSQSMTVLGLWAACTVLWSACPVWRTEHKVETTHKIERKGVGPFGVHGRASATVQNGSLVLWTQNGFTMTGSK